MKEETCISSKREVISFKKRDYKNRDNIRLKEIMDEKRITKALSKELEKTGNNLCYTSLGH
tara:strand:- start:280 stop:462 length:183 start_codon:yes stop_codon:yes gene_type:complete